MLGTEKFNSKITQFYNGQVTWIDISQRQEKHKNEQQVCGKPQWSKKTLYLLEWLKED
jgi:hypothetical protein